MFFWTWHPLLVALFTLSIDFGIIIVIRIFRNDTPLLSRWWAFKIGDSILLPIYAACAAVIIQENTLSIAPLYYHLWWHVAVLISGYLALIVFETIHILNRLHPLRLRFWLTNYHAFIFGIMFYLVVSVFPIVIFSRTPSWAFVGAILSLLGYAATVAIDNWLYVLRIVKRYG